MRLTVRAAAPADADAVAHLLATLTGEPVTPAQAAERLAAVGATGMDAVFLAERDGQPVGLAALHWAPQLHRPALGARVLALVVAEEARGGGIGAALLDHCEAHVRAQGCGFMEITSDRARTDTHRFYVRQGYDATSLRFRKTLG